MRAVVVEPDSPGHLAFREVEEPSLAPSEALVKLAAISLNRGEVRRAQMSSEAGFRPGWDLAGTVERRRTAPARPRAPASSDYSRPAPGPSWSPCRRMLWP